eukprot:8628824-Pyramimonas_sp.AAC.1
MATVSMPSEEDIIKIMKSMLEKVLPSASCSEVCRKNLNVVHTGHRYIDHTMLVGVLCAHVRRVYVHGVAHDDGVLEGEIDIEPEDVQDEG